MSQTIAQNMVSVLVVDDVAENRDLLVRRLKRLGIDNIEQSQLLFHSLGSRENLSRLQRREEHGKAVSWAGFAMSRRISTSGLLEMGGLRSAMLTT
jgi:CheY-like chemotaxis protein